MTGSATTIHRAAERNNGLFRRKFAMTATEVHGVDYEA
jgi:hypothetical protein